MNVRTRALVATAAGSAIPAMSAIAPLRRRVARRLSGAAPGAHIALTFDDGPDPRSTPRFIDLLAEYDRKATFFLLGEQTIACPRLVRRMVADGHEVAVHGWRHRCVLRLPPGRLTVELRNAKQAIEDLTGTTPQWYRPPYGVLNTEAVIAARGLGLQAVLWTAWGRDWERDRTPEKIVATVTRALRPGGTILLHDTDLHAPHGDWHQTLHASAQLLSRLPADVGPLREHWPARHN